MKVKIPESITLSGIKDERGQSPILDFVQFFMLNTVVNDQSWGKDLMSLFEAMELRDIFKDAKVGDEVEVPDVLWRKALKVIKKPSQPYQVPVVISLRPFFEACGVNASTCGE